MAYLMSLGQNISYVPQAEVPLLTAFLSTVSLLAMATHPLAANILYALYGSEPESTKYNSYVLQTWKTQSTGHTLIDNTTIAGNLHCRYTKCEMEVSFSLLLIQTHLQVLVFLLNNQTLGVLNGTSVRNISKTNDTITGSNEIYRTAAIYSSLFYLLDSALNGKLVVETINTFTLSRSSQYYYNLPGPVAGIEVSSLMLVLAYNHSQLKLTVIPLLNFYNGTYPNASTINLAAHPTIYVGVAAANSLRMAQGYSSSSTIPILWLTVDEKAFRYNIFSTPVLLQSITSSSLALASSNSVTALFYEDSSFTLRSFSLGQDSMVAFYLLPNNGMELAAINKDTTMIAVLAEPDSQRIMQYQMVQECSAYQAVEISSTSCQCSVYNVIYCDTAKTSPDDSSSGGGVPIPAVAGGAVGAVVVGVLAWVFYKKVWLKMGKPTLTPYKYNPVEILSFEM